MLRWLTFLSIEKPEELQSALEELRKKKQKSENLIKPASLHYNRGDAYEIAKNFVFWELENRVFK